jgi:hypothetical protein
MRQETTFSRLVREMHIYVLFCITLIRFDKVFAL